MESVGAQVATLNRFETNQHVALTVVGWMIHLIPQSLILLKRMIYRNWTIFQCFHVTSHHDPSTVHCLLTKKLGRVQ